MSEKKAAASIGFEKRIWEAAGGLRGNMDASEHKSIVLGLIFLKYIFACFAEKHGELVAEGEGFEEDVEEYISEGVFFVPPSARWDEIAAKVHTMEIGEVIDQAIRSVERANSRLVGILPQGYARAAVDQQRLGSVVELLSDASQQGQGDEKGCLGRLYEYCLFKFAEQGEKLAAECDTPSSIVQTLAEVLQPCQGRVYDPCCGSGGMLLQAARFAEQHSGSSGSVTLYGQEADPEAWRWAKMNLMIHGIDANLGSGHADSFAKDCHTALRADYVMANPPFNLSAWGADQLWGDDRWQYGMPPGGNANFAWLQHMLHHLAPAGKIGMVLANGSLSSQSGGEGRIRRNIIEADLVECIVALPPQLFYTTQIPVSLWFLSKRKRHPGTTLFIDARKLGTMVTRRRRELTGEDIGRIAGSYKAYCEGNLEAQIGFCAVVHTGEIAAQDYILTPGRYVGAERQAEDSEHLEQKLARLTGDLAQLFAKSHALEEELWEKLSQIRYRM